jgi:hypothetical protein
MHRVGIIPSTESVDRDSSENGRFGGRRCRGYGLPTKFFLVPELASRRPRDAFSARSVSLADIAATSCAKKKEFKKCLWHRHFLHSR